MERDYAEIRNYVLALRFGLVRPAVIRCIILSQKSLTRVANSDKTAKSISATPFLNEGLQRQLQAIFGKHRCLSD